MNRASGSITLHVEIEELPQPTNEHDTRIRYRAFSTSSANGDLDSRLIMRSDLDREVNAFWARVDAFAKNFGVQDTAHFLDSVQTFGGELRQLIMPPSVEHFLLNRALASSERSTLVLVTDLLNVPWELLFLRGAELAGRFLADLFFLTRRPFLSRIPESPAAGNGAMGVAIVIDQVLTTVEGDIVPEITELRRNAGLRKPPVDLVSENSIGALCRTLRDYSVVHFVCDNEDKDNPGMRLTKALICSARDARNHVLPGGKCVLLSVCSSGRGERQEDILAAAIATHWGAGVISALSRIPVAEGARLVDKFNEILELKGRATFHSCWEETLTKTRSPFGAFFALYGDVEMEAVWREVEIND